MDTATAAPRTLTIAEAAEATGISKKGIRNRVDRQTLDHVLRDGLRRIPMSSLIRAGLLGVDGEAAAGVDNGVENRQVPHRGGSQGGTLSIDVGELIDRLERQAGELGEMRALQRANDTVTQQERDRADRLQEELLEAKANLTGTEARISTLEERLEAQQAPRRWFRRRQPATA